MREKMLNVWGRMKTLKISIAVLGLRGSWAWRRQRPSRRWDSSVICTLCGSSFLYSATKVNQKLRSKNWMRRHLRSTIKNMEDDTDNVTTVPNLIHFQAMEPDVYNHNYTTPIIIDNGCTTYRFGFADASTPYTIANIYSRYRERKHNFQIALFGDNVEVESGAKTQSKTAWEGDILINFDAMENALDYAFCKLGLDTSSVMHPVVISERLCTPMYSRSGAFLLFRSITLCWKGPMPIFLVLSELLFEGYNVPKAAFAIDALMSFYYNTPDQPRRDGIVVSFNSASTSVIPVLNGKGILSNAKRYGSRYDRAHQNWICTECHGVRRKRQNTYWSSCKWSIPIFIPEWHPSNRRYSHSTRNSVHWSDHLQWMLRTFCELSPNYLETLRILRTPEGMRLHDRIVQFPYVAPVCIRSKLFCGVLNIL